MPSSKILTPLAGSGRALRAGSRLIGPPNPKERLEVTVRLRSRSGKKVSAEKIGALPPHKRHYLSREEFAAAYGAAPADAARIKSFARKNKLAVVSVNLAQRNVILSGSVKAFNDAFQVKLMDYEHPQGNYRGRIGQVHLPAGLIPIVEGVFGLDNRCMARPHFVGTGRSGTAHAAASSSYTALQVAQLYDFPAGLNGSGECIGILEFGGGYNPADLTKYFKQLGIAAPSVSSVSVDGAKNSPGDPNADPEVALDIEVAGAIAPGARIVVYFAPFTEQGWVDALTTAMHDTVNKPSVLSISWGYAEGESAQGFEWTAQAVQAVNQTLQAGTAMGVSVCVASGDSGSSDGINDGLAHVDFPASSPCALGCGGTKLTAAKNKIQSEVVWNQSGSAGGGGISAMNPLPTWQTGIVPPSVNPGHQTGRGVPDVCGDADPSTGFQIFYDGQANVVGGTSAVAPLWAGLLARINQKLGTPVGYFNPLLYSKLGQSSSFRDITKGNNDTTGHVGGYSAGKGWDACTGWGSPDGANLLQAFSAGGSSTGVTTTKPIIQKPGRTRHPKPSFARVAPATGLMQINHIVVLMLENRSFDQMLGFLYAAQGNKSPLGQSYEGLTGNEFNLDSKGNKVNVFQIPANDPYLYYYPKTDPGEGFYNTNAQLFGTTKPPAAAQATNGGFITNFGVTLQLQQQNKGGGSSVLPGTVETDIMGVFTPSQLPVLSGLARGYAVCDLWFGSAPTLTLPNRAFVHMGTSQGHLDDSARVYTAPSIFSLMDTHNCTWAMYGYDQLPETQHAVADISQAPAARFGKFQDFQKAVQAGALANYVFLEPSWGSQGNSQHPNYDVAAGEALISQVYTTLFGSKVWNQTLLIITYDEHGGCFDHVPPPANATPPDNLAGQFGFQFTRFGPRVPTVLVSPWIEAGTVFRVAQSGNTAPTPFDHTSVLKTIENRFGLPSLTKRDAAAPDVGGVLTLATARTDNPLAGVSAPVNPKPGLIDDHVTHLQQVQAEYLSAIPNKSEKKGIEHHDGYPKFKTGTEAAQYIRQRTKSVK